MNQSAVVAVIVAFGIAIAAVVNGQTASGTVSAARAAVRFTEISHEAGVDFGHVNGASADKHLVEPWRASDRRCGASAARSRISTGMGTRTCRSRTTWPPNRSTQSVLW